MLYVWKANTSAPAGKPNDGDKITTKTTEKLCFIRRLLFIIWKHTHTNKHLLFLTFTVWWHILSLRAEAQICIDETATLTNTPWQMRGGHRGDTHILYVGNAHTLVQATFLHQQPHLSMWTASKWWGRKDMETLDKKHICFSFVNLFINVALK